MPYTFYGPTGSKTLIDHFIVTVNISQYVNKYYTLDFIENISDHMPLYVEIDNQSYTNELERYGQGHLLMT